MPRVTRHPSVSAETARQLRRIIRVFKADPKKLDMGEWGYIYNKKDPEAVKKVKDSGRQTSSCGTVGCIAGWAVFLNRKRKDVINNVGYRAGYTYGFTHDDDFVKLGTSATIDEACQILGVDYIMAAQQLFYPEHWPQQFYRRYTKAKTPRTRANVTIQRIEHFIATGE